MDFKRYEPRTSQGSLDKGSARRLAIETTQNIANLKLGPSSDHPDIPALTELLIDQPLPVAQVAKALTWDSERTAEVLARGGEAGLLSFSKRGDTTYVGLFKEK